MKRIKEWKHNNGYEYKGWYKVFIVQMLRKINMMWVVPFYYSQDDYDDGIQTLDVWRFGKYTEEKYQWFRYEHDLYYKMSESNLFNKREMYKFINTISKRINTTN